MSDEPEAFEFEEVVSHTEQVAISHSEIFKAYVNAGFNEEQALDLLKVMIAVSLKNGSGE